MPTQVYARKVTLKAFSNSEQEWYNEYSGSLFIPKTTYTKAEIDALYSSSPSNVQALTITWKQFEGNLFGAPYYNPGWSRKQFGTNPLFYSDLSLLDDYGLFKGFSEQSVPIPMEHVNWGTGYPVADQDLALWADANDCGIEVKNGAYIRFIDINGVEYCKYNTGYCMGLGVNAAGDNASCGFVVIVITSDNYVNVSRLYINKNNGAGFWMTQAQSEKFIEWLEHLDPLPEDPFSGNGYSGTGGGNGNWSHEGDVIDFPSLPTLSASDTAFVSLYNPSLSQLYALADYMWSPLFDIATLQKLFADPMDIIIGLMMVPVDVPSGSTKTITVGNISTGIQCTIASSQYTTLNCGSITIHEYSGSYLDYEPYTRAEIYLPYIGFRAISVDDIMGTTVEVQYSIDCLSGACTAFVKCGPSIKYTFAGQCGVSIPLNAVSYEDVIRGIITLASTIGSKTPGHAQQGSSDKADLAQQDSSNKPVRSKGGLSKAASAAQTVIGMKPTIERSGAYGSASGILGVQYPYIVITRPRLCIPEDQNYYQGYPAFETVLLGNLSGFSVIDSIHLEGFTCTQEEKDEIEELLKGGVIF